MFESSSQATTETARGSGCSRLAFDPEHRFTAVEALATVEQLEMPAEPVGQAAPWVWIRRGRAPAQRPVLGRDELDHDVPSCRCSHAHLGATRSACSNTVDIRTFSRDARRLWYM